MLGGNEMTTWENNSVETALTTLNQFCCDLNKNVMFFQFLRNFKVTIKIGMFLYDSYVSLLCFSELWGYIKILWEALTSHCVSWIQVQGRYRCGCRELNMTGQIRSELAFRLMNCNHEIFFLNTFLTWEFWEFWHENSENSDMIILLFQEN